MTKAAINSLGVIAVLLCGYCWLLDFAYMDWLRFESPRTPNLATGQTVYVKAVHGTFYVTPAQASWSVWAIPYIIAAAALAILLIALTRPKKGEIDPPAEQETPLEGWTNVIGAILLFSWIGVAPGLMSYGDNVMQFVLKGSLSLPKR